MLTQNPTKTPVEIENQRFSFHCLWQTRNIGRQGRWGLIGLNMNAKEYIVLMFKKNFNPGGGYIVFQILGRLD